ncbi:hypothetical protein [Pseudarthrobacter sp. NKDBFgelt]|uniref:hypothetical protein n=1 Tax=Pseudarthrobacter sp. NKDBFgelt TaxID=3384443 RepID=UPI0038D4DE78
MLEGELRFFIDEPAGHHKVAGNPFRALCFERFDLVLGGTVEFLAGDVLIDLRRPLPVRTVRAAEVADVGFADRAVFRAVPAKGTGTCISPAGATIETARCAILAVAAAGTVAAVTERLPVLSPAEAAAVSLAVTARTITEGLLVTIAIRLAVTIAVWLAVMVTERLTLPAAAEGLAVTVAKRLTLPSTETTTITLTVTTRTITKRLLVTIAIRLAVTVTKRLTLPAAAETTTITLTVTTRTIAKGLLVTIAIRLAVTVAKRLTLPSTETTTVTLTVTTRTITKRLPIPVTERLTLTAAGGTSGGLAAIAVAAGAEAPGIPA